jgi:NAD(P)H dehydrogenase (quinone)
LYSGHVKTLANEVIKGLETAGVNAKLFQVAETLPQDILDKMHAPPKDPNVPVISPDKLPEADGKIISKIVF